MRKISHHLQVLCFPHYKGYLYLCNNQRMGTLPREMGDMTQVIMLVCTHCINYIMDFYSVQIFVYLCYKSNIRIWRVLTDQNTLPISSIVTF